MLDREAERTYLALELQTTETMEPRLSAVGGKAKVTAPLGKAGDFLIQTAGLA